MGTLSNCDSRNDSLTNPSKHSHRQTCISWRIRLSCNDSHMNDSIDVADTVSICIKRRTWDAVCRCILCVDVIPGTFETVSFAWKSSNRSTNMPCLYCDSWPQKVVSSWYIIGDQPLHCVSMHLQPGLTAIFVIVSWSKSAVTSRNLPRRCIEQSTCPCNTHYVCIPDSACSL